MPTLGSYRPCIAALVLLIPPLAGCTTYWHSVPAYGPNFLDAPRASKEAINFIRLRQDPPQSGHEVAPGDILGIYIEKHFGGTWVDPAPGVDTGPAGRTYIPNIALSNNEDLPPKIGDPVPVRADHTIVLPGLDPIQIRKKSSKKGMSLDEVTEEIRYACASSDNDILRGDPQIVVNVMKPRTYHVLVVREDRTGAGNYSGGGYGGGVESGFGGRFGLDLQRRGMTYSVELPVYQNDVLHALAEAGGLPGLDAKNEIKILRGTFNDATEMDRLKRGLADDASRDDLIDELLEDNPFETTIPLRTGPGDPAAEFTQEDIILQDGDIIFIETREQELFYTGGLLGGGQFPIPRDYDLDILGAIALARGRVAFTPVSGGYSGAGGGALFPPTRAIILRTVNGCQQVIRVDLKKALRDPKERIVIEPNDFIVLEYKPCEVILNYLFDKYENRVDGAVPYFQVE